MYAWYQKHLGLQPQPDGSGVMFHWREADNPENTGLTVWSIFSESTKYFGPSNSSCMFNYRVENLDALLQTLKNEGVNVDPKVEEYEFGKFAWITDPEGNRIELWEPKE
jgi:predicted enzyme related to lactoylglutathione lyase